MEFILNNIAFKISEEHQTIIQIANHRYSWYSHTPYFCAEICAPEKYKETICIWCKRQFCDHDSLRKVVKKRSEPVWISKQNRYRKYISRNPQKRPK